MEFRNVCDHIEIDKRVAGSFIFSIMEKPASMSFEARLSLKMTSAVGLQEEWLNRYVEVVIYLLCIYATENNIAKTFKKPEFYKQIPGIFVAIYEKRIRQSATVRNSQWGETSQFVVCDKPEGVGWRKDALVFATAPGHTFDKTSILCRHVNWKSPTRAKKSKWFLK